MNEVIDNIDKISGQLTIEKLKGFAAKKQARDRLTTALTTVFLTALKQPLAERKACFGEAIQAAKEAGAPTNTIKKAWEIAIETKYNGRGGWRKRMQNIFENFDLA